MSANVEDEDGGVAVGADEVANTSDERSTIHCQRHCTRQRCLCVVTVACVFVTSLVLTLICVSSIQRDIDINKLQQQVAELQQTVAILHHHLHQPLQQQQQQQHSSVARQDNSHQQLQTIQVSEQLRNNHLTLLLKTR